MFIWSVCGVCVFFFCVFFFVVCFWVCLFFLVVFFGVFLFCFLEGGGVALFRLFVFSVSLFFLLLLLVFLFLFFFPFVRFFPPGFCFCFGVLVKKGWEWSSS